MDPKQATIVGTLRYYPFGFYIGWLPAIQVNLHGSWQAFVLLFFCSFFGKLQKTACLGPPVVPFSPFFLWKVPLLKQTTRKKKRKKGYQLILSSGPTVFLRAHTKGCEEERIHGLCLACLAFFAHSRARIAPGERQVPTVVPSPRVRGGAEGKTKSSAEQLPEAPGFGFQWKTRPLQNDTPEIGAWDPVSKPGCLRAPSIHRIGASELEESKRHLFLWA